MFLHLSVSHSVHRRGVCLSACWDTPPQADTPLVDTQEQTPPRSRHSQGSRHPQEADTPLHSACWEIQATSGWYTSYWNAYLLLICIHTHTYTHTCILVTGQLLMSAHIHTHTHMHTSNGTVTDVCTHTHTHTHTNAY